MVETWELPERKATYILRYYLPRPPYVTEETTLQRLDELLDFCRRTKVEAVQFYVNLRDGWYYMPDSKEHAIEWAREMKLYIPEIRKAGISYQLNFQNLLGSIPGGADFRENFQWEYLVDHRGNIVPGCACPIGAEFRGIMGSQLRAWAETKPDVMWIDDDFRYHNHGFYKNGMDWYCYCPRHLEQFSQRIGRSITREELIQAMIRQGEPSSERIAWQTFLNETISESAAWIREQVHLISPGTRLAQMTSGPDVHSVEGRNWGDFLAELSGKGYKPITRPHFGPYTEFNPADFFSSYMILNQTITNMKIQYKGDIDACPEVENTRFTRWAKSAAATRFQLILGQLAGCRGITLSLFDLEGTPLSEEPLYEKLLTEEKAFLDSLAELQLDGWRPEGVVLLTDPEGAGKIRIMEDSGSVDSLLGPGRTWDRTLLTMGIPAYYMSCDEATGKEVVALDGLTAWFPDDKKMEQILSGGVLLDAGAAEILVKRGFGPMIGVSVAYRPACQTSGEIFHGSVLEGMPDKRMPLRIQGGRWAELIPGKDVKILSHIIDPKGVLHPGTVLFENPAGGRIAVYSGSIDLGADFYNHTRVLWCSALLNWLGRGNFPVNVAARQRLLTVRRDSEDGTLLAFANLAADTADIIEGCVSLEKRPGCVKRLLNSGEWSIMEYVPFQEMGEGRYRFSFAADLGIYEWIVLIIE